MARFFRHIEHHAAERLGWLRAAVLGANDGILSTASLIIGVATAQASRGSVLVAGAAGLVAGAMSMAAGEFVSVSSQADAQRADLARERRELGESPEDELRELSGIYEKRGLEKTLAREVATQLMAHDALGAHARDELGISNLTAARPIQAALSSALAFAVGAGLPLALAAVLPWSQVVEGVAAGSLVLLALLGVAGARFGRARLGIAAFRVTLWGAFAMGVAAAVGAALGTRAG